MKRNRLKSIVCLVLAAVLSGGMLCLPVGAAKAEDIPCPKCGSRSMVEQIEKPTCTKYGGCFWVCQACGMRYLMAGNPEWNALNQPALGHNYVNGVCTRCGEKDPNGQTATEKPGQGETGSGNADSGGEGGTQACAHAWSYETTEATCTRQGQYARTCSLCGEREVLRTDPPKGHQYKLTETVPATTQQEGKEVYTCSACGDQYEKTLDKLPVPEEPGSGEGEETECTQHQWRYETTPATCTQTGEKARVCTVCGEREVVQTLPKTSHSWRYDTIAATCSKEGKYVRTCKVCGTEEVMRTLPKSSHRWTYETVKASCTQEGQSIRTCSVCGEKEVLNTTSKLGHQYTSAITQAATAEREGQRTYTCSRCGDSYTEAIPKLTGTQESPIQKDPNAKATASDNLGDNAYNFYRANPMKSYLYERKDGGFTRVEAVNGSVVVEAYDQDFQLLTSSTVPMELSLFGGFFAGESYNFLVFGQNNPTESDSQEVIRVVKYSKDWERLGQASLKGANTYEAIHSGSLRCAEYNGMLYVHTCHTMYASARDGLHHQANLIFSVRQSDMTITDSQYRVSAIYEGYVSHSFNQFVLVDQKGRLVTANHGDAIPRAATVHQYALPAGEDTFVNYQVRSVEAVEFASSGSTSYNYTGAWLGGLEASASSYLLALSTAPQGSQIDFDGPYNVVLAVTGQDIPASYSGQTGLTQLRTLTSYTKESGQSAGVPQLVKVSDNRFLVLWDIQEKDRYGNYSSSGTIGYVFVDGQGNPAGQVRTAQAGLSDCQPILAGDQVVWYATDESLPTFYTMDASSGALSSRGGAGETGEETPVQPGTISYPDVSSSYWGYSYIVEASRRGLVAGCPDGTFQPDSSVTAAQFCTMLTQGFYSDALSSYTPSSQFWWEAFVETARREGVLQNTSLLQAETADGSYNGQAELPLTRYEMALMMYNLVREKGVELPKQAEIDAARAAIRDWDSIPANYQEAVATCYAWNLLSGGDGGQFDGSARMTRAQACVVLSGLLNRVEEIS